MKQHAKCSEHKEADFVRYFERYKNKIYFNTNHLALHPLQKHKMNPSNDRQKSILTLMIHISVSEENQRCGIRTISSSKTHNDTKKLMYL